MTPADSQPLTTDLLARFESSLFDAAPAYESHLRPGLTDAEIDTATASLPGRLSREARAWWGWRNGLTEPPPEPWPSRLPMSLGNSEITFTPLGNCVSEYFQTREMALGDKYADPEFLAPKMWFPLDSSMAVSVELVEVDQPTSRVFFSDGRYPEYGKTVAPSLGTYLSWWTDSLESGGLRYGADFEWQIDRELVHPELVRWGWC